MILVDIHAPNDATQQVAFLRDVSKECLIPYTNDNLVLGSDFNCTSTDCKHQNSAFDPTWLKDFPLLQKTNEDDNSGSGMLCNLCRKHNQRPQRLRQGCAVWVDVPCFNYKQDALKEHEKTNHHNVAVNMEAQLG